MAESKGIDTGQWRYHSNTLHRRDHTTFTTITMVCGHSTMRNKTEKVYPNIPEGADICYGCFDEYSFYTKITEL